MSGTTMSYCDGRFVRMPQARPANRSTISFGRQSNTRKGQTDRFIARTQHMEKPAELAVFETLVCVLSIAGAAYLWLCA
jgi:hypothetical protein